MDVILRPDVSMLQQIIKARRQLNERSIMIYFDLYIFITE